MKRRRYSKSFGSPRPPQGPDVGRPATSSEQLDRLHLYQHNVQAMQMMLSTDNTRDPVLLLVDSRDPFGAALCQGRDVPRVAPGMIPTVVLAMERAAALGLLRQTHPRVAEGLATLVPQGPAVPVVVVASRGVSLMHIPRGEAPASADA